MKKDNYIYLDDILEAINKIEQFTQKINFSDFEKDERTQFAVFHALEIIGEAANKLSPDFLKNTPEFPVREAVELRNFLIHGYDQISLDVVWKTIHSHLPELKLQIEKMISQKK